MNKAAGRWTDKGWNRGEADTGWNLVKSTGESHDGDNAGNMEKVESDFEPASTGWNRAKSPSIDT